MTIDTAEETPVERDPFLTATRMMAPNSCRSWTITEARDGRFLMSIADSSDGLDWGDDETSGPFDTWQAAVLSDPALTSLRSGQPSEFDIDEDESLLTAMLKCDRSDEFLSWPTGSAGRIGEYQIFFLEEDNGGEPIPFLATPGGEIDGEEIADYFADSYHPGGYTETSSLIEFAPGLAVFIADGDEDNRFTRNAVLIVLSDSPASRASGVAEWLGYFGANAEFAAVLELAVLDPYHHLNDEQREDWNDVLTHPYCRVQFMVDDATRLELVEMLVPSDIEEALEDPQGESGRALYVSLTEDDHYAERFL